ncbi:hypothetical protein [Kitasatospora sp. GP82]|uniref:hypothetical protein n=1 Tax=Kitasatospora sp. GP82 TaxID=3035089 RepID=UPI0024751270|nr:hypothetical protein [Kitasatospora sp. GP82]MDH6126894.1 hypothetical protein [Kitasatospora sp. GP82]
MPIRTLTFRIVTCDICGDEDTDDVLPLYDTRQIAADNARQCGWLITADQRVICPDDDRRHRAALDDLMPPEPTTEVDGQLSLDLDLGPAT